MALMSSYANEYQLKFNTTNPEYKNEMTEYLNGR